MICSSAAAQDPSRYNQYDDADDRYGEWRPEYSTDSGGPHSELIDDLRLLIRQAEQQRAADPVFIKDLRDTLNRYQRSTSGSSDQYNDAYRRRNRTIIYDDFRDGDFSRSPAWQVASGDFRVDRSGLRSVVNTQIQSRQKKSQQVNDVGDLLFNVLINELDKNKKPENRKKQPPAILVNDISISNAFRISLKTTVLRDKSLLEWGVYQNEQRTDGYRIRLFLDSTPLFQLIKITRSGVAVLVQKRLPAVNLLNKEHTLVLTRNNFGEMQLILNDTPVMRTVDSVFAQGFNGFLLKNHGGEYRIREVQLDAS